MKGAGSMFGIVTWMTHGCGLVWGGLWMILSSMLLMLVSTKGRLSGWRRLLGRLARWCCCLPIQLSVAAKQH